MPTSALTGRLPAPGSTWECRGRRGARASRRRPRAARRSQRRLQLVDRRHQPVGREPRRPPGRRGCRRAGPPGRSEPSAGRGGEARRCRRCRRGSAARRPRGRSAPRRCVRARPASSAVPSPAWCPPGTSPPRGPARARSIAVRIASSSAFPRRTLNAPHAESSQPSGGQKSSDFAMNLRKRRGQRLRASGHGSKFEAWPAAITKPPSGGKCSLPEAR